MGQCMGGRSEQAEQQRRGTHRPGRPDDGEQTDSGDTVIKILLLGAGESGKSTVIRQMRVLYGGGYDGEDLVMFRPTIISNLLTSLQVVLNAMGALRLQPLQGVDKQHLTTILSCMDPLDDCGRVIPNVREAMLTLWENAGVQESFKQAHTYQLNDSAAYFFQRMKKILQDDYVPNRDDMLRARVRTTGISEDDFRIGGVTYRMLDVGGQRSERRKWIQCFDDVKAVIFVAALSGYDMCLYEEETQNRLQESLQLFEAICNNRFFQQTSLVLLLNKVDLFRYKILYTDRQLKQFFPSYDGPPFNVDAAAHYIQSEFLRRKRNPSKTVYMHFTTATDTSKIQLIFDLVFDSIVTENLDRAILC